MSSQSAASRRVSTSYTYGIPGSQVTISISKNGDRSLTLSRGAAAPAPDRKFPDGWVGPADTPFCKVCYDAGLPVADYTDHFVKDQPGPDGKVVCPTLLAQKCLNCGVPGHTTTYCPERLRKERESSERENKERELTRKVVSAGQAWATVGQKGTTTTVTTKKPRIEDMNPEKTQKPKSTTEVVAAPRKTYGGSFGVLGVDDSSSDDERQAEIQNTPAGVPKPVLTSRPILTGPPPAIEPAKPLTWAQRAAAAAQKPTPAVVAPPPANVRMTDARFQLHAALCDKIEVDKRSAMVASKRAAAAAVANESARRRKQDSAMVPA